MGGEGLVILPVAERGALAVEGGERPVKNFEGGQFLLFGSKSQTARQQQKNKDKDESRPAAHADEIYFAIPRWVTR